MFHVAAGVGCRVLDRIQARERICQLGRKALDLNLEGCVGLPSRLKLGLDAADLFLKTGVCSVRLAEGIIMHMHQGGNFRDWHLRVSNYPGSLGHGVFHSEAVRAAGFRRQSHRANGRSAGGGGGRARRAEAAGQAPESNQPATPRC